MKKRKQSLKRKEVNSEVINSVILVLERTIGNGPKASGKLLKLK